MSVVPEPFLEPSVEPFQSQISLEEKEKENEENKEEAESKKFHLVRTSLCKVLNTSTNTLVKII